MTPEPTSLDRIKAEFASLNAEERALMKSAATRGDIHVAVALVLNPILTQHRSEIEQLTKRLDVIEQRPALTFDGPFEGGKSYTPGAVVQHQSCLWVCQAPTSGTPSKDFTGWKLLLKKGDAR